MTTLFSAFNRWLDDDWAFEYQDRLFASPYISLADVEFAVSELQWALGYPFALGLMFLVSFILWLVFRTRGWL